MPEMPGFDADDLMGWIAAVGALRAMSEAVGDKIQMVWCAEGAGWRLHALEIDAPEDVAERVHAWLCAAASAWDWGGFDNINFGPDDWARAAGASRGLAAELWVAIGSDGSVRRDGRIEASRLEYAQGGGHQDWLASLRGAVRRAAEGTLGPQDIARVLWGTWRRQDRLLACRWDWRWERDHALMAADPTSSKMRMRQDHAATALAAVGLASLPTAPTAHGLAGALAGREDKDSVYWPVWQVPMGIADIETLVASRALLHPGEAGSNRELAAQGVGAVMTARRWYTNKQLIVFGRGRELART